MWRSIGAGRGCGTNGERSSPVANDALFAIFGLPDERRLGGSNDFNPAFGVKRYANAQDHRACISLLLGALATAAFGVRFRN